MKKNRLNYKQVLMAILMTTSTWMAWGQSSTSGHLPQNGKVYRINSLGTTRTGETNTPYYLTSNEIRIPTSRTRLVLTRSVDKTNPAYYFRVDRSGNNQALFSLARKMYFTIDRYNTDNASRFRATADPMVFFNNGGYVNIKMTTDAGKFQAYGGATGITAEQASFDKSGNAGNGNDAKFVFTEVTDAAVVTIRANIDGLTGATYTVNDNPVSSNPFVALTTGDGAVTELRVASTEIPTGYTFTGFTWPGQTEPQATPTIPVSALEAHRDFVITANYAPSFYSSSFGEKWVRIFMVRSDCENYAWRLNDGNGSANLTITTAPVDYADDRFLWCFVGNDGRNFTIKNKATGAEFALTTAASAPQNDAVPFLTAAGSAKSWKHSLATANGKSGYKFNVTSGGENKSPNAHGGKGRGLAYWDIDAGSLWRVEYANATVTLNTAVRERDTNTNPLPATQKLMARVQVAGSTAGINVVSQALLTAGEPKQLHLPTTGNFTLATPIAMRNFGSAQASYSNGQAVQGDVSYSITATYVNENAHYLFTNSSASVGHYKVPAVAVAPCGDVLAIANYSLLGETAQENGSYHTSAGILGGASNSRTVPGKIRLALRVSNDGNNWAEPTFITPDNATYGDAAITADHKENKVLVMVAKVTGDRTFNNSSRTNRLGIARIVGTKTDAGWTWSAPQDATEAIYGLNNNIIAAYFSSGRILQSKVVKNGSHFRLYAPILTRESNSTGWKNRVVYSDDFGTTWHLLGTTIAIDGADESTLVEAPDGRVIISSRKDAGRKFNIFTYTNIKTSNDGAWGAQINDALGQNNSASCNGEMLLVNVKRNNQSKALMLHSLPMTNAYSQVGIYHKEMNVAATEISAWGYNWTPSQAVGGTSSGYSTMDVQKDGNIGFFFEENLAGAGYDMVYKALPVSTFNSSYTVNTDVVAEAVNATSNTGFVGSYETDADVADLVQANTAYSTQTALLRRVEAEMNHLKVMKTRIPFDVNKYYRIHDAGNTSRVLQLNYFSDIADWADVNPALVSQFWKFSHTGLGKISNPNVGTHKSLSSQAALEEDGSVTSNQLAVEQTGSIFTFTDSESMEMTANGVTTFLLKPIESVSVNVASNYSTFYYPFAVTIPDGITVYSGATTTTEGSQLVLQRVDDQTVPALTPAVLQAETPGNKVFAINYANNTPSGTNSNSGSLRGVLASQVLGVGNYILRTVGVPTPGFYEVKVANTRIPANRAYIVAGAFGNGQPSFLPFADGEKPTTSIHSATTNSKAVRYYNLNGTPVAKPVPGTMYITSDGKKVIFK